MISAWVAVMTFFFGIAVGALIVVAVLIYAYSPDRNG